MNKTVWMKVKHLGAADSQAWKEDFNPSKTRCLCYCSGRNTIGELKTPDQTAEFYGREIVDYFNDTLRPGETPREFVGIIKGE